MQRIIRLRNSISQIEGLTPQEFTIVKDCLSYKVDFATARFIRDPRKRVKYCIDKKGHFATGLLGRVERLLNKHRLAYIIDDQRSAPIKRTQVGLKPSNAFFPYPEQAEAVISALDVVRGVIKAPTGSGKSFIIALLISEMKLKTLIVVPTLELKYQLTKSLTDTLTSMSGVTVENIDSTALKTKGDYDMLIIDECHRSASKTYRDLNKNCWNDIYHRYCFSATPFRNQEEEELLYEGVAGEVIYELTFQKAVQSGYIVPVEGYYYEVPRTKATGHTYAQVYNELVVNNQVRNEMIADIIKNLYAANKFALCLVKEIKHGEILSGLTGIPFANGADEDSRQWIKTFNEGRLKCLIGTSGILSEGIDTKPCEYVIIAGLGKAKSAFMQSCGRGVRRYGDKQSAKVVLFKDHSHRWTLTSFKTHAMILMEEYGTKPLKLDVK